MMSGTMDIDQAAELLKVHPDTLASLARRGEIPATKVGRAWVFSTRLLQQCKPRKRVSFRDMRRAADKLGAYASGYQWTDRRGRHSRIVRRATPAWANADAIRSLYAIARAETLRIGIPHEVDHVIPLRHDLVCGLHVESNLEVITESANCRKGNRWDG